MAGTALAWDPGTFSAGDEQLLFSLTNQDRASAGLNALVDDGYLHKEAEWRAKDMGDRNYFSHEIPPDNKMVFDYMQSDGYCFKVAGENIGLSTYGDARATSSIEVAFMGSPSHRANILGTWANLSVGAYKAADGRKLYDVLFSIPCGVAVPRRRRSRPLRRRQSPTAPPTSTPTARPTADRPRLEQPTGTPAASAQCEPSSTPTAAELHADSRSGGLHGGLLPRRWPVDASGEPSRRARPPTPATATSLRVYEKPASQGPIDSLFNSLFGGLFDWCTRACQRTGGRCRVALRRRCSRRDPGSDLGRPIDYTADVAMQPPYQPSPPAQPARLPSDRGQVGGTILEARNLTKRYRLAAATSMPCAASRCAFAAASSWP